MLKILSAVYGSESHNIDVTAFVGNCLVPLTVSNTTFNVDPHYGVRKYLKIQYVDEMKENTIIFSEGETISIDSVSIKRVGRFCIPCVEHRIIDSCNLKCDNCSVFAPYYKTNVYPLDVFKNDIDAINKLLLVSEYKVLGGEPLLVKDIIQYLLYAKQNNFFNRLVLITNGTLLPLLPTNKINTILDIVDELRISYYPSIDNTKLDEWLFNNTTNKVRVIHQNSFIPYFSKDKQSESLTVKTWEGCNMKKSCCTIDNGKFYPCFAPTAYSDFLSVKYNTLLDISGDCIDLQQVSNSTDFQIAYDKIMSKPLNTCYYCTGNSLAWKPHTQLNSVERII